MQTLLSMIEPIEKEVGCLNYAVFCDIENNNRFSLLEEWETREYLDYHIRSTSIRCFVWNKYPVMRTAGNSNSHGLTIGRNGGH